MLRTCVLVLSLALLAGCSAVGGARSDPGPLHMASAASSWSERTPASALVEAALAEPAVAATPGTSASAAPRRKLVGGSGYTILQVGAFDPRGDLSSLNTGLHAEVIFGNDVLPFLSLEASLGYLTADGNFGPGPSNGFDMWAIPLMVQAKASVPVLIFEPYVGVGLGGMYVSADATVGPDFSDFVGASTAFGGVSVGLGRLAVGAEAKYLKSGEVESTFEVEGWSSRLFMSLPF